LVENNEKIDFMYEVLKDRHDKEIARRQELDGKADRLIQCVTIVTGITIGLGTTFIRETLTLPQLYIPYFFGIGLLLFSITISLWSSRIIQWSEAPNIDSLLHQGGNENIDKSEMKSEAIMDLDEAITDNYFKNQKKAKAIEISWGFMLTGLITLVIFLFIFVQTPISAIKS
jgi:hypothetical protein